MSDEGTVPENGFVLRDRISKMWFKQMTGIGPACTAKIGEAQRFQDRDAALQSPAMCFSLTAFEPEEV